MFSFKSPIPLPPIYLEQLLFDLPFNMLQITSLFSSERFFLLLSPLFYHASKSLIKSIYTVSLNYHLIKLWELCCCRDIPIQHNRCYSVCVSSGDMVRGKAYNYFMLLSDSRGWMGRIKLYAEMMNPWQ